MSRTRVGGLAVLLAASLTRSVRADVPPGYPEPVIQWGVQKGETCEDIARAAYGDPKHAALVTRYNRVSCTRGAPLKEGLTLVLPASVTEVPSARIRSLAPSVRARPAGGGWTDAAPGQPLENRSSVQTLEEARADIQFVDRTRVFMAENTLVVIYGTADQTRVSKALPPAVELESGEVRAALAALRGDSVEVAAQGGRVSATSRDTVISTHGDRANVSVFDGSASVESAGKRVVVPERFGTRFQVSHAPEPPRPLPPAPAWQSTPPAVVHAEPTGGIVAASWSPIPRARNYRVEVAHDAAFDELELRAEVGADATSFRFEKLPLGEWFVRVRAIDDEDFLGLASEVVHVTVVAAEPLAPVLEPGVGRAAYDPTLLHTVNLRPATERAPASRALGVSSIPWAPGAAMGRWWAPLPDSAGWLSGGLGAAFDGEPVDVALRGSATTHVGPVGIEASFESDDSRRGASPTDVAWLGARVRVARLGDGAFELGPGLRLGAPTTSAGSLQAEAGLSLGARFGIASLLGSFDFDLDGAPAPYAFLPNAALGGALDPLSCLRVFAIVDGFGVTVPGAGGEDVARAGAGLSLGAEAGRVVFGGASVRVMPFDAPTGEISAQLAVGLREEP